MNIAICDDNELETLIAKKVIKNTLYEAFTSLFQNNVKYKL